MRSINPWNNLVTNTKEDGSTVLLFHGGGLEAFYYRARGWLKENAHPEEYDIALLTREQARAQIEGLGCSEALAHTRVLMLEFSQYNTAVLFKLAVN